MIFFFACIKVFLAGQVTKSVCFSLYVLMSVGLCNFALQLKMVFCYQNCSDLLREKIVLVDQEKLLKFKAEGREFAKILRSLNNLFKQ